MIDIFLSASIPLATRDEHFAKSADILAIREAIKALVEVVIPIGRITFGGHPAITPLIAFFVREAGLDRSRLTIFQSRYFEGSYPPENNQFNDIKLIAPVNQDRAASLDAMRRAMIESRSFSTAVAIGGMEGVIAEIKLFSQLKPHGEILPIASTGAAAADIFRSGKYPRILETELTYYTLFRRHFSRR